VVEVFILIYGDKVELGVLKVKRGSRVYKLLWNVCPWPDLEYEGNIPKNVSK